MHIEQIDDGIFAITACDEIETENTPVFRGKFIVYGDIINVGNVTASEKSSAVSAYYSAAESIITGEHLGIIAECIFRIRPLSAMSYISSADSFSDAEEKAHEIMRRLAA